MKFELNECLFIGAVKAAMNDKPEWIMMAWNEIVWCGNEWSAVGAEIQREINWAGKKDAASERAKQANN